MSEGMIAIPDEGSQDTSENRQKALRYILEAWDDAVNDGVESELLASAALFAALSELVTNYGEEAVARLTDGLSERIDRGEFTLQRTLQ